MKTENSTFSRFFTTFYYFQAYCNCIVKYTYIYGRSDGMSPGIILEKNKSYSILDLFLLL